MTPQTREDEGVDRCPWPRHCALVPLLFTVALHGGSAHAARQPARDGVRLTLSSQTVWQGATGWCALSVDLTPSAGGISDRCGAAGVFGASPPGPAGGGVRERLLTIAERTSLRTLYEEARLFDGGHIGADQSASDLPFIILMVRPLGGDSRAVVVVVTGNPTFSTGARKALLDRLLQERQTLTERARPKK